MPDGREMPAMPPPAGRARRWLSADGILVSALKTLVVALAWVAGAAVLLAMAVTCLDIALRLAGRPLKGAFDIVRMAGAAGVFCALPYTTAIKGHVAVEFFFQKLGRGGRMAVDGAMRSICIALFCMLAAQCYRHGLALKASGQVSATLQWPVFWIAHLAAFCFTVTAAVVLFHLLRPGKEMLKP